MLLTFVEHVGLLAIAIATVFAITNEVATMVSARQVALSDLLLLFLYLEVLAMVDIHYKTGKLPVRSPIYIGMVALARYLNLDLKSMDDLRIFSVTCSILILALAVLLVRFGHIRFRYSSDEASKKP